MPFELFVVADFGRRPVSAAKVVEQVWRGDEEDGITLREALVANRGREMSLATTVGACQDEPARRIFSKVARAVTGEAERFVLARIDGLA